MTYAELQTIIADELMRQDLAPVIPGFIRKAEGVFNRRLRAAGMITQATLNFTDNIAQLPADFLEGKTILFDGSPARFVPVDKMDTKTITIVGNTVWKGDGLGQTASLYYFQRIPALSNSNTTNWLLTSYPDLYIEAGKGYAYQYIMDEARSDRALAQALASIEDINLQGEREQFSGAPLRRSAPAVFG